jgi:hypothetical protein
MGLHRGIDGSEPVRPQPVGRVAGAAVDPSVARVQKLGTGTLACPGCDAPVALGAGARRPHDALSCPFCGCAGALRDFLSLAAPTRPARVEIRLVFSSG